MKLAELFAMALDSLRVNKLRSALTLLGVVIGVMTVVSVLCVVRGLNDYVLGTVVNLNPDVVVFTKFGILRSRTEFILARRRKPVTMRDLEVVQRECRSCGEVGAQAAAAANLHVGPRKLAGVPVTGYTANAVSLLKIDVQAGRFFTPVEDAHAAPVAVVGWGVKDQLFPDLDPVGRTVWLQGHPLRVVGLQKKLGKVLGQDRDNVLFVPLSFLQKVMTADDGIAIMARPARGMASVEQMEDEVRVILRSLRKTPFRAEDPFGTVGAEAIRALWRSISAAAFAVMLLVSGISLVVGGIVIANIMFVSVVERTHEIGLRMALGARRRDIQRQFVMEAALLASVGGAGGCLGGALVALAMNQFIPTQVQPSFVALGLVTSIVTGVLAGLAPAATAARLTPVEALRQE